MPTAPSPSLLDLGWDDDWAAALDPGLTPGRVSRIDRGMSTVITAGGPVRVAAVTDLTLAVGDWVALAAEPTGAGRPVMPGTEPATRGRPVMPGTEPAAGGRPVTPGTPPAAGGRPVTPDTPPAATGRWVLAAILPRRCAFRRATDGPAARVQVVAANIDTVLLVDAMDGQLTVRHLERYVALAWQSGAVPVVVVTKADLASPDEVSRHVAAVEAVALDVAVHVISSTTGQGLDRLAPYLATGRTVALLGLSGAGKSTLVNLLAGDRVLATGAVRGDGKGRHTTTHRELVAIPGGGLLIDTPGMRALSVSTAVEGVAQVFADVEDLATRCGFPDCSHTTEPGCAIVAAVAAGELSATRLASWRQLRSEPPTEDPQAVRLRIVERKRQKAKAKAGRAESRAARRTLAAPPTA